MLRKEHTFIKTTEIFTTKNKKSDIGLHFYMSLMCDLIEDSWILIPD